MLSYMYRILHLNIIKNLQSRWLRWARHVACMELARKAYRILVGKPEGQKSLGKSRRRWEDIIKMNLKEVGYVAGNCMDLAQDRGQWRAYVRLVMNLLVS